MEDYRTMREWNKIAKQEERDEAEWNRRKAQDIRLLQIGIEMAMKGKDYETSEDKIKRRREKLKEEKRQSRELEEHYRQRQ
jgi:spermidine/putrescine-binding protein